MSLMQIITKIKLDWKGKSEQELQFSIEVFVFKVGQTMLITR